MQESKAAKSVILILNAGQLKQKSLTKLIEKKYYKIKRKVL